ncbi:hypothetical protein DI005_07115 [Prauserella sp. PE36]|uniref:Muconolactone isomerase domain-containing protein n=1 Tax=Prauserella endophytica TaxID=1592324 RepID=A0ABY2S772_9PSEU|nr:MULTISPECIES: hypothetical protein [Prauserella]PXY25836.1 hypothetical protein BAY59_19870 [Prauserella coralliicola]RBM22267.1 hypothetical protein DI005_07115 [Prauserella sp. PE36]TKG71719.1 hypothetical protein FCN18_09395 [Prauserella endophytica]
MKFMVRQKLGPDEDVTEGHLQPLARLVADSMLDEPKGPVVWLGGCGTVDTKQYYMLFEAPDYATLEAVVKVLPGLQSVERVMAVDKHTLARGLLLGMAKDYDERIKDA